MSEWFLAPCHDCGESTIPLDDPSEWYMVRDEVWAASGLAPRDGYLCIGCLEKRLGRRLRPYDFTDAPVNGGTWKTARLLDRLGVRRARSPVRRSRHRAPIAGQLQMWDDA